MKKPGRWPGPPKPRTRQREIVSKAVLNRMIEDATVDCYDEGEAFEGIRTRLEDELHVPFETVVLGLTVTIEGLARNDAGDVVAVCACGRERQRVPLLDVPLPMPRPRGWEWIEAYRKWVKGR